MKRTNPMKPKRVLVCGGRNWRDSGFVWRNLTQIMNREGVPFECLIEGECPYGGVDLYAKNWAVAHGIPVLPFPPKIAPNGRVLGSERNAQMLREGKPDLVIAFPGGIGTANMCKLAKAAGVRVERI